MPIQVYDEDIKNPDIGPDIFSGDNKEIKVETITKFLYNEVVFYGLCLLCGVILFLILFFVKKKNTNHIGLSIFKHPIVLSILYILFYSIFSFIVYRIYKTYIDDIHDTKDDTKTKNGVIAFIFFYTILFVCLYIVFPLILRPKELVSIIIDNTSSVECPHIVSLLQHFSLIIQKLSKYIFYGLFYFPIYVSVSNPFSYLLYIIVSNFFSDKIEYKKSIIFTNNVSIQKDIHYTLLGLLFFILTIFYRSRLFFIQGIPEHIVLSIYIFLCILCILCIVIYFILFILSANSK